MSVDFITSVFVILLIGLLTALYTFIPLKLEGKKQKELLEMQAKKRGGQVHNALLLQLPIDNFILNICPDLYASSKNFKTLAILGSQTDDETLEKISHFPKIAVFKKQTAPFIRILSEQNIISESEQEEINVRRKQKRFSLGDKKFDKTFSVYAENEDDVHRILTSEIRQNLLELSSKSPRLNTDELRFFAVSKKIKDSNTYDTFIDVTVSILKKLI